jgi:hypothetical protein
MCRNTLSLLLSDTVHCWRVRHSLLLLREFTASVLGPHLCRYFVQIKCTTWFAWSCPSSHLLLLALDLTNFIRLNPHSQSALDAWNVPRISSLRTFLEIGHIRVYSSPNHWISELNVFIFTFLSSRLKYCIILLLYDCNLCRFKL